MYTTNQMGATSDYNMGIASTVILDVGLAAAGSVASWLAGIFNYDLSQEIFDLINRTLGSDDVSKIQGLQITQDAAGYFDMPVCQVQVLRSFPPASQGTQYSSSEFARPTSFTSRPFQVAIERGADLQGSSLRLLFYVRCRWCQ